MTNMAPRNVDSAYPARLSEHPDLESGCAARVPRVLLAEDDDDLRLGLTALLRFDGYDVYAVADGTSLLDKLASRLLSQELATPVDVIVTDVRMPGVNGLAIVEGLRADGWAQPVVLISAFGDDEVRARVERLESVVFLAKPFEPAALERVLADLTDLTDA
ncbi:MAG TPA: response regulator [Polyangiales bacterium]